MPANLLHKLHAVFSAIRVYTLSPERKAIAIATFLILSVPALVTSVRNPVDVLDASERPLKMPEQVVNALDTPKVLPSPFNCTNNPAPIASVVAHG